MSVSYYVQGVREPDEEFNKMKKIYDLCKQSNVEIPSEVYDYFEDSEPNESGLQVDIPYEEFSQEDGGGYKVKVKDIPKNITDLKFIISC